MKLKTTCIVLLAFLCISASFAQTNSDWLRNTNQINKAQVSFRQDHMPTAFQLYSLNIQSLSNKLVGAPMRGEFQGRSSNVIAVPNLDGTMENYSVMDTQTLHPELQTKFPNLRSYVGQSIENPGNYIRFSVTNKGFHAQIFNPGEPTVYIDPYTKDRSAYIIYSRKDLVNASKGEFSCETDNSFVEVDRGAFPSNTVRATNDGFIRVYELALSCTGEYSDVHSNVGDDDATRKADVMSEMVIAMDRVNGVYEKEMGITFMMIANNDLLIYLDPATDPWDDEYNDKTQEVIDNVIGDANYDIGHNFNTSGGGNAGCIGCVCESGEKGSAFTGLPNPTGDPFYIDFVAHEIGHQIGGYHTHNGTGTCLKSGNNTEVEPGSGSSIMGYAGICPGQDIQNQSDDYFNYVNIRDISANIQGGVSSTCPDLIDISSLNSAPTADAGPASLTIPIGTAFQLTGVGTDSDSGDILTYTWEQNDNEDMQTPLQPSPTATAGPMFRSRRGTTNPWRYFPQLSDILVGDLMPRWEVIPQVGRDLQFALTVRDNVAYGGQTADDLINITTSLLAGPFVVSSQNNNTTWVQGDTETISWDVAGTNLPPVNSLLVNILFSATGDFTDTVILANNTLNDGSEEISVPATLTSTGRFMVKAADNVFLDVNDGTITIEEAAVPTFFLTALDVAKEKCANTGSETFNFEYTPSTGFTETVMFSVSGMPSGTTPGFTPAMASVSQTNVTLTINDLQNAPDGDYTLTFTGTSTSFTKSQDVTLSVKGDTFPTPTLSSPADASTGQSTYPSYMWSEDTSGATESYDIEISDSSNFSNIIESSTVETNSYTGQTPLQELTAYYWRVKPKNECGDGTFTSDNSFTTGQSACQETSNNTPTAIVSTFTMSSTININESVAVSDINVPIEITHPYIGDLVIELVSPAGTSVVLVSSKCDSDPDLDATFDDAGMTLVCSGTSPSITGTLIPQQALSAFNGEDSEGTWTLNITDTGIGDDGALTSWTIEYCGITEEVLATETFDKSTITMYPNPASNLLNVNFTNTKNLGITIYDMLGRKVLISSLSQSNKSLNVSALSAGTYLVQMTNDNNQQITKQLIIE